MDIEMFFLAVASDSLNKSSAELVAQHTSWPLRWLPAAS